MLTDAKKKKHSSKSSRLGLTLSVSRVDKKLRDMRRPKRRVGAGASIYTTAVIETILKDTVRAANKLAVAQGSKQLLNRHLQVGVYQNDKLNSLMGGVSIGTRETTPAPIDWILTTEQQKTRAAKKAAAASKTPSITPAND
jgi:histone H2A